LTIHHHLAPRLRINGTIAAFPHMSSGHAQGQLCLSPHNISKIKQLGIFSIASAAS